MTRRFKMLVLVVVMLLITAGGMVVVWAQHDEEEPVTILGTWTAKQAEQFETVLRDFGIPFRYQGTAAQREVLLSQVQSGEPPDIVIMPGLGELAEYADQNLLKPLDGLYDPREYGAPWKSTGSPSEHVYWVPVKADLKSIVWYRKGHRPDDAPAPMRSWCIGMGDDGASGWPGTDWIEDLVLQRAGPKVYEKWALDTGEVEWWRSAPVVTAWEAWADLLGQDEKAAENALLTDHRGAPDGNGLLFDDRGGCTLEHQGSFALSFYRDDAEHAGLTDSAPLLPGGGDRARAHEVTGDFAALFSDRPQARALIRRLASEEGQQKWAERANVFSANRRVGPPGDAVEREIARRLGKGPRCLDASDVMAPAVRDAFYEAVLLTIARTADGQDPDIPGLLRDVQRVQDAQSAQGVDSRAAPKRVCSTR
ncbi:ABC transporter substrate-binding protein [Streptomyces viridosporus]|uniref:Carbohydrate ABC transporter substrate-binding protein n=1 Tax=Streptomyces viridosporus T7A TaxID=665577 RepID=A0ABX6AM31_STRVD|nr:ABC transporter substrate-binding protein [Streptomyces viridosporus]QEU88250.1 carbohydrate ABC transporter substrate-binding protein [Streptomyces viridosporus T7A]